MLDYSKIPLITGQKTFRLLEVFPKQENDEDELVKCSLTVSSLDGPLQFEFSALSYTWGDPTIRRDIVINGVLVSVSENLEGALQQLRKETESINLWVDAVCIDQQNDLEKGEQVARMHLIYVLADQTIAWLGPAAEGSDMAMRAIRETGTEAEKLGVLELDVHKMSQGANTAEEARCQDESLKALDGMARRIHYKYPFKAVKRLLKRPYWSRMWVFQEFALAQRVLVQCGAEMMSNTQFAAGHLFLPLLSRYLLSNITPEDYKIPMDPTSDYEQYLEKDGVIAPRIQHVLRDSVASTASRLISSRRSRELWVSGVPGLIKSDMFFQILENANTESSVINVPSAVSVAKDRVYGLLGIVEGAADLGFEVDYTASDEEVFTRCALGLLLRKHLSVLAYARIHKDVNMPSWAPDWRGGLLRSCAMRRLFKPEGNYLPTLPVLLNEVTLRFYGLFVATISKLGVVWQPELDGSTFHWDNALALFKEVDELIFKSKAFGPPIGMSRAKLLEGLWRIPIADQYTNEIGLRIRAPPAAFKGWKRASQGISGIPDEPTKMTVNYYTMAMGFLHGRRLIETRTGFIGLAPVDAQLDDIIIILPGVGSPLVLRPVPSEKLYQIVGEAYVYGIMDGEMFVKDHFPNNSSDPRFEYFDIC